MNQVLRDQFVRTLLSWGNRSRHRVRVGPVGLEWDHQWVREQSGSFE